MATVTTPGVWISRASDLSDCRHWNAAITRSASPSVMGEFREYAAGVWRFIKRPSRWTSIPVSVPRMTREDREWLEALAGEECLYRDGEGRKVWGTFAILPGTDQVGPNGVSVSLTFGMITHSEEV